jgi:hypothetical protein
LIPLFISSTCSTVSKWETHRLQSRGEAFSGQAEQFDAKTIIQPLAPVAFLGCVVDWIHFEGKEAGVPLPTPGKNVQIFKGLQYAIVQGDDYRGT